MVATIWAAVGALTAAAAAQQQPNVVHSLPGYGGKLKNVFAGHVAIDAAGKRNLFYWLFGSASIATDPVVVWFQGGGGASPPWGIQTGPFAYDAFAGGGPSTFGLFNELGPFLPPDNSSGHWVVRDNPNSWGDHTSLLFIDQPVGVGLSFFEEEGGYAADMAAVGADAHAALRRILLEMHPQFGARPLYLFGESYAGHYVPSIAHHILGSGDAGAGGLNLVGLGLGDVCPGEEHSMSLPELMHGLGYIDAAQLTQMASLRTRCRRDMAAGDFEAAFKSCEGLEIAKNLFSGGIHDQDSRRYAAYPSLAQLVNVDAATSEDRDELLTNAWLDLPAVRRALNVGDAPKRSLVRDGNQPNTTRGMWLGNDNARSTLPLWPRLISSLRVLVYNGNFDVSCNHLGTERNMKNLGHFAGEWAGGSSGEVYTAAYEATERRWFTIGSQMAGYYRHVALPTGSLTLVVGQGGGHLYPHDQPARMHTLLGRFLQNMTRISADALCDQERGICRPSDVAALTLGSRCALLYNCSGHGACTDEAMCVCDRGFSGVDCSTASSVLDDGEATVVVASQGWHHFTTASSHMRVSILSNATGVDLHLSTHGALPALGSSNASWRLPARGRPLTLSLRAALEPLAEASGIKLDHTLPWTLGVFNALDQTDSSNLEVRVRPAGRPAPLPDEARAPIASTVDPQVLIWA